MQIIGIMFQSLTSYLKLSKDYDHFFKNSYLHKINIYNILPKNFLTSKQSIRDSLTTFICNNN